MALPAVEELLRDPLKTPETMERWSRTLKENRSSGAQADFAGALLDVRVSTGSVPPVEVPEFPALGGLVAAMAAARPLLGQAVASLTPEERTRALAVVRPLLTSEAGARPRPEDFDVMERFDLAALISATVLVTHAVDEVLPALRQAAPAMASYSRLRFKTAAGILLLSGGGDDSYSAEDLSGVALLVDFGGKSRYAAAPAAAGEGELKVVIDLSRDITVEGDAPASGVFGIGLLYLPEAGPKSLQAGSFSLGAGLFGAGGLWLQGDGARLSGGRFSQGAAAFGLGFCDVEGKGARYELELAGQGFGFTRGVGLFRHEGSSAVIDGGLTVPDGREPLAALSLSQGAGNGPRAFAAGGIGLALVAGGGAQLHASYMAQGMGYWHAFGGLFLSGDENRVVARRYAQGAGVHTAVGGFRLEGSRNHTLTWGVGPGMGWDYGAGFLDAQGDDNAFSSQWASGRGDVNGHGLVAVQGDRNVLALADLGSGALKRGAPSYGLAFVSGKDNRIRSGQGGDPWGIVVSEGALSLDFSLEPEPGDWKPVPREAAFVRDQERVKGELEAAQGQSAAQRLAGWLAVASGSGFDNEAALRAAQLLLTIKDEELPLLVGLVNPDAFDDFVWLRTFIPAFGLPLIPVLAEESGRSQGLRQVLLLSFYRQLPVSASGPVFDAARSQDWHMRREAAASLGRLFGKETGQEPGRLRLLVAALRLCRKEEEPAWLALLGEQNLTDLFGVLSLGPGLLPQERAVLFAQNNPFEPVRKEALEEFARLLRLRAAAYAPAIEAELKDTAAREPAARKVLLSLLGDADKEVVQAALTALGGIGEPRDAARLAAFWKDASALLRDSASASLGRMGAGAKNEIARGLKSGSPKIRVQAALAAARSSAPSVLALLEVALTDKEEGVQRSALAGLLAVQTPLRPERRFLRPRLKLLSTALSAAVRTAASRALADISD